MIEKRRYKITSFKEIPGTSDIRVLMDDASAIKFKTKGQDINIKDMMMHPGEFAQNLMNKQVNSMVRDTFLISKEQYDKHDYDIGDFVIVTIEKE